MTASEPVQAPRTAWMNGLRDEAVRMDRPEISKIVHIGWVIASFGNSDGSNCDPGTETIAAIVGSSDETVSRAKKVLKALGVLVEKRRPNTSSLYRIRLPLGGWHLDWDAHMHLYTDTPQARRKRRLKEQQIVEQLATREKELAAARTSSPHRVQDSPPGVANQPDPVPAGGSTPAPEAAGTRSGTGAEPVAERVPEPVHAGRQPESPLDKGGEAGAKLASVPSPGRTRRPPAAAATQPPLLLAVQGHDGPTRDKVRQTLAQHGVAAALRRYGREPVMRELATGTPTTAPSPNGQTELTVSCSYCDAPAGTPCRSSLGFRTIAHQARLADWDVAYATCSGCKAPAGRACLGPDGTPRQGIHPQRAGLGAQMRQIAEPQSRIETGT